MTPAERRSHRARIVQIALGCIWIVDAALQLQPRMFGHDFINQMILPNAQGQPAPVAWSITQMGHFLSPDVGVWNFLFAMIQLLIGVGMLFRRTVRPAIVAMAVWALGVWWFGEGFGGLLNDTASPLMGAPGAVVLYRSSGSWSGPERRGPRTWSPASRRRRVPRGHSVPTPPSSSGPVSGSCRPHCGSSPPTGPVARCAPWWDPWPPASRPGTPTSSPRWPTRCRSRGRAWPGPWPSSPW